LMGRDHRLADEAFNGANDEILIDDRARHDGRAASSVNVRRTPQDGEAPRVLVRTGARNSNQRGLQGLLARRRVLTRHTRVKRWSRRRQSVAGRRLQPVLLPAQSRVPPVKLSADARHDCGVCVA
jgi:hypothetical protein